MNRFDKMDFAVLIYVKKGISPAEGRIEGQILD